jgi:hypothetical protein
VLIKQAIVTFIPGVDAVEGHAASLTCVTPPPVVDTGGSVEPPPNTDSELGDLIYLYVPNDPDDVGAGEVRTPAHAPEPAGYVCDTEPTAYLVPDPSFPGGTMTVYEIRCYWTYP